MAVKDRKARKAETREKILRAAAEEFGRRSILAARMDDVAKAAGVSHGTVFLHFSSQEALVAAVIWEFGQKTALRTHELAGGLAGVREVLAAHLKGIGEAEDFYTRLATESPMLPMECRNGCIMVQSSLSIHLSEAANKDAAKGIVKHLPTHMLFNTWMGLVHYYLVNRELFAPGESVIRRCGDEMIAFFMNLIEKTK